MTTVAPGKLVVERFTATQVDAVRAFNQRLAAGGAGWRFPDEPQPGWLPYDPECDVYQELLILLEGEAVRGGYALKHQPVSLRGEIYRAGNMYMPLSEGTISRAYSLVGARLFADAVRREPLMFTLGLGGGSPQVTDLVRALGWEMHRIPFYFKVIRPYRFLRRIRYLRTSRFRAALLDLAAFTGAGWLVWCAARSLMALRASAQPQAAIETVDHFGSWADQLWDRCASRYSFTAVRTSAVLNRVYPSERAGMLRLKVSRAGRVIGYAVILDELSLPSEPLGDMRVGTLLDAFALPEDAEAVVSAAAVALENRGVDLIVSNQSHPLWGAALRCVGFLGGPSNCLFAAQGRLARMIRRVDADARELHLSRGDGDWPWGFNLRTTPGPS